MANSIIGAAVQGAVRGASKGSGLISAPFKAGRTTANGIKNVNSGIKSFRKKQTNQNFRKK